MGTLRRRLAVAALGLVTGVAGVLPLPARAALATTPAGTSAAEPRAGVNLAGLTDWTVETPFVDVFRTARDWVSQATTCPGVTAYNCRPGYGWAKGPKLETDANGWVTRLAAGQYVDAPIFTRTDGAPAWPAGTNGQHYTVTWKGDGDVTIWGGNGKIISRGANRFEYEPGDAGVRYLAVTRTTPSNYVRDIHVWMPGYDAVTGPAQVFHPDFLASLAGLRTLRFMTWMHTNGGSPYVNWSDYPTTDWATQSRGVAPELMAELANRVGADAWLNIPHQATDDFVRKLAKTVRASLDPKRKVYLEYSNEVWNGTYEYPQSFYAQQKGLALGLGTVPWQAGMRYQARRSVEIFRIWREVFGDEADSRIVRVLATQAGNMTMARTMLEWKDEVIGDRPAYTQADAVAIAPYFHCGDQWIPGDSTMYLPYDSTVRRQVLAGGVDRLLDACEHSIDGPIRSQMVNYKQLADGYGLSLVAYEGGQHLNAVNRDDAELIALFTQANRQQRMRDLYARYLRLWRESGGGTFALFLSAETPSRYGASGLREYQGQPLAEAPKARATEQFMQSVGQLPLRVLAPTVTGLSIRFDLAAGGRTVTISGTNLDSADSVRFGGVDAPFRSVAVAGVTQLTATVPPYPAGGLVDVKVGNPAGVSAATAASSFTYFAPPAVTAMSTTTVLTSGGTAVTLTGTNMTGVTRVNVGALAVTPTLVTATSVRFTAPARAAGTADVTVTSGYGTSTVVPAARLTYAVPPPPALTGLSTNMGPSHAPSTVVITGTNLLRTTRVTVGQLAATSFSVVSDTEIRAVLPAQAGGVVAHIQIVTPDGTSATHARSAFYYVAAVVPAVFGFTEGTTQPDGSRTVTVNGKGFTWATQVTAAGKPMTFTYVSETQIRLTLPAAAPGTWVTVQVITPAGASPATATSRYTYR